MYNLFTHKPTHPPTHPPTHSPTCCCPQTSLTNVDSSYDTELTYVSWLFLALGAITTAVGIVFWSVLWTRGKPAPSPPKYRPSSSAESVQLVGIYKISEGHVNRAHTDDSGHVIRASASSDVNRPRTDDSSRVSREHTKGDGHVNRAHTDDDGNVKRAGSDENSGAGACDDVHVNVTHTQNEHKGQTETV